MNHVPEDLLQAFVDGDVGEQVAVHVAEHLDSCPSCATRAAGLEPLAAAFAAVEDPVPPAELVPAVLARARQPDRMPMLEIGVGVALIAAAALLAVGLQTPAGFLAELGEAAQAAEAVSRGIMASLGSSWVLLLLTMSAGAGVAATLQIARSWRTTARGTDVVGWGDPMEKV